MIFFCERQKDFFDTVKDSPVHKERNEQSLFY